MADDSGKPHVYVPPGEAPPAHLEVVLSPGASWGDISFGDQKTSPLLGDAIHASNLDVARYREIKTDAAGAMDACSNRT